MEANTQLNERRLADAWAELHAHANNDNPLHADAYRLAFADPEFLFRRETRGIRFQLEMLKPDLGQAEQGIENTVVVYGSARFVAPDEAAVVSAIPAADVTDTRKFYDMLVAKYKLTGGWDVMTMMGMIQMIFTLRTIESSIQTNVSTPGLIVPWVMS